MRRLQAWLRASLTNRVTLAAGLLAAGFLVATLLASLALTRSLMLDLLRSELRSTARIVTRQYVDTLATLDKQALTLSRSALVSTALSDSSGRDGYLLPFLSQQVADADVPYRISLVDYAGRAVVSLGPDSQVESNATPRMDRAMIEVMELEPRSRAFALNDPVPAILLVHPVRLPATGQVEGYIVIDVALANALKPAGALADGSWIGLHLEGRPPVSVGNLPKVALSEPVVPEFKSHLDAIAQTIEVSVDATRALAPVARLPYYFAAAGVFLLIIAAWLARYASVRVLSPLRFLTEQASRRRDGDINFVIQGEDELARLGRALQNMVEELTLVQRTLEVRVEMRTTKLKRTEAELRAVQDSMFDALVTITPEGIVRSCNRAAEQVFGWPAAELIGQNIKLLMPDPHSTAHDGYLSAYINGGPAKIVGSVREVTGLRRDGSTFPMELAVTEVKTERARLFVGTVRDITARREAEAELRKLAFIVQHADTGVVITDAEGQTDWVNDGFTRITGYSIDEMRGRRPGAVLQGPQTSREAIARMHEAVATGKGFAEEVINYNKAGEPYWVALEAHSIKDDAGQLFRFVAMQSDISERKRAEQARSDFISVVSHELRTPLTAIRGALGLIAGGAVGELAPKMHKLVDMAAKNSERLTRLINDLLDIQKMEYGNLSVQWSIADLKESLEAAIESNHTYGERLGVSVVLAPGVPAVRVRIDTVRFGQVMANLISNACKFSPAGASVTIAAAMPDADTVTVSVSDLGPGIPLEFHQRIFTKFSQADSSSTRQVEGTGLGLHITRGLVEAMGGRIHFESEPGQGTRFYFTLPAIRDQ